ncbi:MAG: hypothetical protein ABIR30_05115 [Chitinophagaceae bacterium]
MADPDLAEKSATGRADDTAHRKKSHKDARTRTATNVPSIRGTADRGIKVPEALKLPDFSSRYHSTVVGTYRVNEKKIGLGLNGGGHTIVRSIVVNALERAHGNIDEAWADVQTQRNIHRGGDDNDYLAAAEHYLYAKLSAKNDRLGGLGTAISTGLYSGLKKILNTFGALQILKSGDGRVTPASQLQDDWGVAGFGDTDESSVTVEPVRGTHDRLGPQPRRSAAARRTGGAGGGKNHKEGTAASRNPQRNEYFNVLHTLITENDKFFTNPVYKNEEFIKRIKEAAKKAGLDEALLAAALLQENTDKGQYVRPKDKSVFGIAIGVDHWVEKRKIILEKYPDAKNIAYTVEKNQTLDATSEVANDVRFRGDEAVLAFAYYLGVNKERVRRSFIEHGSSFDTIPTDEQWAFTRLAMNPGKNNPIGKYVEDYLRGKKDVPITMKPITAQDSRHPVSGATLTVARAKHYRLFFPSSVPD